MHFVHCFCGVLRRLNAQNLPLLNSVHTKKKIQRCLQRRSEFRLLPVSCMYVLHPDVDEFVVTIAKRYCFNNSNFGRFPAYHFGIGAGTLIVKISKEVPRPWVTEAPPVNGAERAALWSCRVSDEYPFWTILQCPRPAIDNAGQLAVSAKQKQLQVTS